MYDINFFINKLEAIPEKRWCTHTLYNEFNNTFCALGHCGARYNTELKGEAKSLHLLFSEKVGRPVQAVNDYITTKYPQPHPKQRVLAALYDLKSLEAVKEAEQIIKKLVSNPSANIF